MTQFLTLPHRLPTLSRRQLLLLLIVITFVVYLPSFGNQMVWDDEQFIYANHYVRNFDLPNILTQNTIAGAGQTSNYYRPLTTITFAIDHSLWGLNPIGFHLTNTLMHAGAGVLLFLVLSRLRVPGTWWISLFFLLHPLQTEAVVYINSRGDSLYAWWLLLGLLLFDKSLTGGWPRWGLSSAQLATASLGCFWLAILSKEIALAGVGLFGLIWLVRWLAIFPTTRSFAPGRLLLYFRHHTQPLISLASIMGSALVYLALRATILNFENSFNFYGGENIYTSSGVVRLATFSKIFWTYVSLLVWPHPLHMERDSELLLSLWNAWSVAFVAMISVIVGIGHWEWRRHQTWWVWFGSAWFTVMLLPVSGIVPINGLLYEHWLYLPMVGFWIVMARSLQLGLELLNETRQLNRTKQRQFSNLIGAAMPWLLILISLIFSALTIRQNYIWRSPLSLYPYTLQFAQTARLHNNLGMAYADAGNFEAAITSYHRALELGDYYPQIYHNLGNVYATQGNFAEAEAAYYQALTLEPAFLPSQTQLINTLTAQKKYTQALTEVEKLLAIDPTNPTYLRVRDQLQQML